MDRAYYNEYHFLERNHWWFVVRSRIINDAIKRLINSNKNLSILNIGIATGATNQFLQNYGNITSIEYDKECASFTYERSGEKIIVASAEDLPFKNNSFDLVCAFDVIEHIENDLRSVEEMKRVCNNGRNIFITVSAYMILWSHHDVVNQHKRRYISNEIVSLFNTKDNSGREIYKTYFNSLLLPLVLSFRLLSRIIPDSLIRKGAGSDFTIVNNDSPINKLLYQIFSIERFLLKYITFPFGSSILYAWRKSL